MNNKPLAKSSGIVMQEVKDECLLYNLETNKALSLNPTAYFIWRNCDGQTDAREIAEKCRKEFRLTIEEDYVFLALDQLEKADLLEKNEAIMTDKISRRKALLKYGMVAALPLVTGIVAPTAAQAASGCVTCSGLNVTNCPVPTDPACSQPLCSCILICDSGCCSYSLTCNV